eukprot:gene11261-12441_t
MVASWLQTWGTRVAFYPTLLWNVFRSKIDRNWYDRIDRAVVLGALPFRSTANTLVEKENVKGVITLNQEHELKYLSLTAEEWKNLGVTQLWIPTMDFDAAPSIKDIEKSIEFIEDFKARNQSVYVHCKAGRGRSALIVVCYLMKEQNIGIDEAFSFVKSKRSHVLLWTNQRRRVEEFYESLQTRKRG